MSTSVVLMLVGWVWSTVLVVVDRHDRALRKAAAQRLAVLHGRGELSSEHVVLAAHALGVAENGVAVARCSPQAGAAGGGTVAVSY